MQQVPVSYDLNNGCTNVDKYAMAHWHWESLHSVEGAIKLHDEQSLEMMEHLTLLSLQITRCGIEGIRFSNG